MKRHTALIGDIKKSRELENWPEIFGVLKKTLNHVNRRFADDILVKFQPTVGDEFQGALKSPEKAFDVYTFIKASLPVRASFGLGIGEIEKLGKGEKGLRGTAFYRARDALEQCKREKRRLYVRSAESGAHQSDRVINTILRLIDVLENSMTRRQGEVVSYYRLNPESKLGEIGEHFDVYQGTVSNILRAAHYAVIKDSEMQLRDLLKFLPERE